MRAPCCLMAALISISLLTASAPSAWAVESIPQGAASSPPPATGNHHPDDRQVLLTLDQALTLAEARNPGLLLAALQLANSRNALSAAPANAEALAPAATAFLAAQYGITIPEQAISPEVTAEQARISYEQAAAQYYETRQQVRSGALQAYAEWQRAVATVESQRAALERTHTQEANIEAALAVGSAARYDLLQVQAAVAGQQAALIGAQVMEAAARSALGQVIGTPLADGVYPEPNTLRSEEVTLPTNLEGLVARAMVNRPDLRRASLDLASRRLQAGLTTGESAIIQLQATATQYELAAVKVRAQVTQTLLAAQGALEELKAREAALEPAREALRLAELRYEAGIATWVEVQGAAAAALQGEVGRIQAATNLMVRVLELRQSVGDL